MQRAEMSSTQWFGKSVVLQVVIDDLRVPVWGTVLGETEDTLRFAVAFEIEDWLIHIEKSAVQPVVEVDARIDQWSQ
jgi:hypothetical protein